MKFALVIVLWSHPLGGPRVDPARDPARDPWFGRDKVLHFVASAAIQGTTHAVLRANGADYGQASRGAALTTLTVGVSKELWDRHRGRALSVRDLAWDVAGGTAAGVVARQVER